MARKRKDDTLTDISTNFNDAFQSELNKLCQFDIPDPVLCSTGSTLLDTIIGGGFPTGKYHVFAAPAHSGKSTTCIKTMANFLKNYSDGNVLWIDGEQATPESRLMQLGMPYEYKKDENGNAIINESTGMPEPEIKAETKSVMWDPRFFRIPVNIPLEKAFELIDKIIEVKINYKKESDPLMVIFDSLDSLPTKKEMETDDVDKAIGQRTKVLGYYMKRYLYKIAQYNICVIFITHMGKAIKMMGPYEPYDGKMASLKDFTIAGGKAIQFYPYNMITFRAYMSKKIDEELFDMGISSGFVVVATTLKAKGFAFNLSVPLVFNTLKGFDEYPTRYYNMNLKEDKWFEGTVSKNMPEFPDIKFNIKSFFKMLNEDPSFKEKVDISWNNYLKYKFNKYHSVMSQLESTHQNIDIDDFDETIMQNKVNEIMNMGEIGELESHTPNTMNFSEEQYESDLNYSEEID